MMGIGKGLSFKIVTICMSICFIFNANAYSMSKLRINSMGDDIEGSMERKRKESMLSEMTRIKIIEFLSKPDNDKGLIDNGLDLLDSVQDPRDIMEIIESAFARRKLRLYLCKKGIFGDTGTPMDISNILKDSIESGAYNIKIIPDGGSEMIGARDFRINVKKKIMTFSAGFIYEENLRGKRFFGMLYRWMFALPCFSNCSGWEFKITKSKFTNEVTEDEKYEENVASYMSARAWWRTRLPIEITSKKGIIIQDIDEIEPGEEYYIKGRFLNWEDRLAYLASIYTSTNDKTKFASFEKLLTELKPSIIEKMMDMPTLVAFLLGLKPAHYTYNSEEDGSDVIEAIMATTASQKKFHTFPEQLSKSYVLYNPEAVRNAIFELNMLTKDEKIVERVMKNIWELANGDSRKINIEIFRESVENLLPKQFPEEPEEFLQKILDASALRVGSVRSVTQADSFARGFILGIPFIDSILFCIDKRGLISAVSTEKSLSGIRYLNKGPIHRIEYIIFSQEFIERLRAWDKALEFAYELMERQLEDKKLQEWLQKESNMCL
ncbi:hypothetical protein ACFL2G_00695 [Candidatus Omnitrophota bacterium]